MLLLSFQIYMVKWLNIYEVRPSRLCVYHIYIGIPNSAMLIRSLLVFSHIFSDFDRYDFSCKYISIWI